MYDYSIVYCLFEKEESLNFVHCLAMDIYVFFEKHKAV